VEGRVQRRLAAILAADVVGYSRLIGGDEEGTLATLKTYRSVIDELIKAHDGRVFGSAGDSVIAEFASPVEAVRCATKIQIELDERSADVPDARRMRFRIGVNLGDVVVEGDNLMGDGVNVAARLEALAAPGGLCISDNVINHVRDQLGLEFEDLGQHQVKNISHPVHVYRVPLASEFRDVSPFRGLSVFEYEDARFFNGRAKAIATAKTRLEQQAAVGLAFLLIYGMSGAGKSSLVRAGLLPTLTKPGALNGITATRYCIFRPSEGPDPRAALLLALCRAHALPEIEGLPGVDRLFEQAPQAIVATITAALSRAGGSAIRLFVVVDQLEELFTAARGDTATRESFIDLLGALARSGSVWVIGTIRTDCLHHCASVPHLSELKDGLGSYELLPPVGPEIAQIIRNPARTVGLHFEETAEEGRLEDVLQQVSAHDPGSLPLLEFVLDALYEAGKERRLLTFAAYRALGGLEGAIAQRADEVTSALPPDVQEALPAVITALTTVGQQNEAATGRPALRREIAATLAQTALVDALIDARLLVSDEGTEGVPMVRFAHEALLSQWPRAREIIAANREFLATRARVRADTRRWQAEQRNPDLLLPAGKRLAEAEDLLLARRKEVDDETAEYIEASHSEQQAREEAEREVERRRLEFEATAARRLARRTRIAAVITLVLAIAAGAGALIGFKGQGEAVRQAEVAGRNAVLARAAEQEADRQAKVALAARDEALRNQSLFLAGMSLAETATGNTTAGILLGLEALPQDLDEPDRPYVIEAEAALYQALFAQREIMVLRGHDAAVVQAAFSPDGSRIVTASRDGTARIWDALSGAELVVLDGHSGAVQHASFSPDGRRIVTASRDGTARIWDVSSGVELVALEGHDGAVFRAEFSPDGDRIVTASADGTARIWDAATGAELVVMRGHQTEVQDAVFSADGSRVVTASVDGTARLWNAANGSEIAVLRGKSAAGAFSLGTTTTFINAVFSPDGGRVVTALLGDVAQVWDATTGTQLATLNGHERAVQNASFSPDGSLIVTASWDNTARVWDATTGAVTAVLRGHDALIFRAAFGPDGRRVVTASADGTARLWATSTGAQIAVLRGHTASVISASFSPDGTRVATTSTDGTARIWNATGSSETITLRGHKGPVLDARFSPSGENVVTASADGTASVWRAIDGTEVSQLRGHVGEVRQAAFSSDGRYIVTASSDGTARLWDTAGGDEIAVLRGHEAKLNSATFSPDGRRILTASQDKTARLWDFASGKEVNVLRGHEREVNQAVYGPGGDRILTVSSDGTGRLWDGANGKAIAVLRGHERKVVYGAFDPLGDRVLTVSEDRTVRVWDATKGSEISVLRGHNAAIIRAAFSPDGNMVVTAARDSTARVWDAETGEELLVLRGHKERVNDAAFSPDGRRIVTASKDGTVRLWDAQSGANIAIFAGHSRDILRISFSPSGKQVVTGSADGTAIIFNVYPSTKAILDRASKVAPRKLTACERRRFFLPVEDGLPDCAS